jgi:transposase
MKCPLKAGQDARMNDYPAPAVERAMKVQTVILKAISGQLLWWEAAEILGVSCRTMRRWKLRYQKTGYDGLFDRRRRRPSPRKVPLETVQRVLQLYREQYQGFNIAHFTDQLHEQHDIQLSYEWVKSALQTSGLVAPRLKRGRHHQRRERRPLRGMMLYVDGSTHAWIPALAPAQYDLVAVVDDADTNCYYAQLVEQESTLTVMAALREVIEQQGLFCSLYTDRGSHFFHTTKAGGPVDKGHLTEIGRALAQLGIEHIPSYCPQGRGRMERFYGSWQGRLPQELRRAGISDVVGANRYIREKFLPWHRRHWTEPAREKEEAFVPCAHADLEAIFSLQQERSVASDNTVSVGGLRLQIAPQSQRWSYAKTRVKACEHLDGRWSVRYGPQVLGWYESDGRATKEKLKSAA